MQHSLTPSQVDQSDFQAIEAQLFGTEIGDGSLEDFNNAMFAQMQSLNLTGQNLAQTVEMDTRRDQTGSCLGPKRGKYNQSPEDRQERLSPLEMDQNNQECYLSLSKPEDRAPHQTSNRSSAFSKDYNMIKQSAAGMSEDMQAELARAMGFSIDDVLEHVLDSGKQQETCGQDLAQVEIADPNAVSSNNVQKAIFAIERVPSTHQHSKNVQPLTPSVGSSVRSRSHTQPDTHSALSSQSHDASRRASIAASVTSQTSETHTHGTHDSGLLGPDMQVKLKKDALYKPLLRKFRTFYRKLIDSLGLSKGCHHWSAARLRKQVWTFMHFLEIPSCFMDVRSLCSMAVILFPTVVKKKQSDKQYLSELKQYLPEIKLACYEIFQENNVKKRKAFFQDPMIQYLWKLFITLKPEAIIHHFRRTRSHLSDGEARYATLLVDMKETEKLCNVQIIPQAALEKSAITLMTSDELEQDLQETGKFNRRSTAVIRQELTRQGKLEQQPALGSNSHSEDSPLHEGLLQSPIQDHEEEELEFKPGPIKLAPLPTVSNSKQLIQDGDSAKFVLPEFLTSGNGKQILASICLGGQSTVEEKRAIEVKHQSNPPSKLKKIQRYLQKKQQRYSVANLGHSAATALDSPINHTDLFLTEKNVPEQVSKLAKQIADVDNSFADFQMPTQRQVQQF